MDKRREREKGHQMYRIVKLEVKNCINRMECKLISAILFGFGIMAFLAEAKSKYGVSCQFLRCADESVFLQSAEGVFFLRNLNLFFPMLASMLHAGSFIDEKRTSADGNVLARSGRHSYFWGKAAAVFLTAFLVFGAALLCNFILCRLVFPGEGYDSMWMEPDFLIGVTSYFPGCMLDFWRIQNPAAYNLMFILIYAVSGGITALFAYGVSFLFADRGLGKLKMVFTVTFFMTSLGIVLSAAGKSKYTIQNYLAAVQEGNPAALCAVWAFYLAISIILIKRGIVKYEG